MNKIEPVGTITHNNNNKTKTVRSIGVTAADHIKIAQPIMDGLKICEIHLAEKYRSFGESFLSVLNLK